MFHYTNSEILVKAKFDFTNVTLNHLSVGTPEYVSSKKTLLKTRSKCVLVLALYAYERQQRTKHREYIRDKFLVPVRFDDWVHRLDSQGRKKFQRQTRMTKKCFNTLFEKLKSNKNFKTKTQMVRNGNIIEDKVKLLITLLYFAGEELVSLSREFSIDLGGIMPFIKKVTLAINEEYADTIFVGKDPRILVDPIFRAEIANGFYERALRMYNGDTDLALQFSRVLGAIDGCAVKQNTPRTKYGPLDYFNRKGYFALALMAICDANYRFVYFDPTVKGTVHDSTAWKYDPFLGSSLEEKPNLIGTINGGYSFFLGDAAYR
jgi:hypothetical protein